MSVFYKEKLILTCKFPELPFKGILHYKRREWLRRNFFHVTLVMRQKKGMETSPQMTFDVYN